MKISLPGFYVVLAALAADHQSNEEFPEAECGAQCFHHLASDVATIR